LKLAAALISLVCACHAVRPQPPADFKECTPLGPSQPLRCGSLSVPEDRTKPAGRFISIAFVVVPATGPRTLPPLYDFAGGPGISATAGADFWAGPGTIHRLHRDVVLVDQRGTGQSAPLDCPEVRLGDPLVAPMDAAAVTACRQRLSAKADVERYSTAESIADFDAVRAALGHERIDISGLSYGSRLAQEYLRAYPDRVRAAALMGAVSPQEKLPLSFARDAQTVLSKLVEQCATDTACHAAIPDLAADIAAVQRSLESKHAAAEPGPFWEAVRSQLLTTASQRRLPWLLHQAAQGDFAPILEVLKPKHDEGSNALLLAVECPEDTLRISEAERAQAHAGVFGDYRLNRQLAACKAWGVKAGASDRTFMQSQTPVLLLAGSMDYVTPLEWAAQIAAQLPNARVVTIPLLGHFPDGLSNMECYDQLIARFFEAGSAAQLDTSCVAKMLPPPFIVR
jgi:pimeloyl-ACP methyl ester carboxylesterase